MTAPLFLKPIFQQRIWGGRQLATKFGYEGVPDGPVGECWGISAHPSAPSTVTDGPHAGRTLPEVWEDDRGFFGDDPRDTFPLLVKLLDARDWLSVQVHPNDAEAAELEGLPLGKTECWYIVGAEPGAELIIGHRARSKEALTSMIDSAQWDELLLRRRVAAGDFVYVPSGTLHSAGPGLLICEVQQNCDTTYRVYDFDRTDADGRRRQLHLDKAKRVLTAPYEAATTNTAAAFVEVSGGRRRTLVRGECFQVVEHEVTGQAYRVRFPTYELCTVTDGSGGLAYDGERHRLLAGDHVIIPADAGQVEFSGVMTVVSSHPLPSPDTLLGSSDHSP
jgi:mannose-6-phosphate isomerase